MLFKNLEKAHVEQKKHFYFLKTIYHKISIINQHSHLNILNLEIHILVYIPFLLASMDNQSQ